MDTTNIQQLMEIAQNAMKEAEKAKRALEIVKHQKELTKINNRKRYQNDPEYRKYHLEYNRKYYAMKKLQKEQVA